MMPTSYLNGGRAGASSRPKYSLKLVMLVIFLVGMAPILITLHSESTSSSSSTSLSASVGKQDMRLVELGWMNNDFNARQEAGRGEENDMHIHRKMKGNNRQLKTNLHDSTGERRHGTFDQSGSSSSTRSLDIYPPVLLDELGNFEPRAKPERAGPGEKGAGAHLDKTEQMMYDRAIQEYGFNMVISDRISVDRTVADLRDEECKHWHYPTALPNTSVIIVFHNEGWSTLVRTIHSIFNTSPARLLAEVLLVDDFSEKDHLSKKLEKYVLHPRFSGKVGILRNTQREGLIRSRVLGARRAVGETVTFLDAHCECGPNWLPPLLAEIALNRTTVVCPTVDAISADDFAYTSQGDGLCRGAFDWDFWYKRIPVQHSWNKLGLKHRTQPYPSPVMAGGLFALDRKYFFELGGYDPGLQIWGGENFEISFKAWMCGGSLKFVPCSRVGHVYRKQVPYTYPHSGVDGVSVVDLNYMRVAEVWLDEYRDHFYATKPQLQGKPCGNLSEQVAFRRAHCPRSFRWFMEEVAFDTLEEYPPPPKNKVWGEIRSIDSELCLDTNGAQQNAVRASIGMEGCHGLGGNQLFRINTRGQLVVDDGFCLYATPGDGRIIFVRCTAERSLTSDETSWDYDPNNHSIHLSKGRRCLDHNQETNKVFVSPCQDGKISQLFKFFREEIR